MKTSKIIAVALAATLLTAGFTSCGDDYDDTVLKGQISDLDQRVTTLEEKVKTDIAAIQASISTIEGYDFVKSVKKVTDGYEITFSKGTVAVITNGTNGKDGINGTDGKDGVNGNDGKDGVNGTNGKDGADGKDGINGNDGKDGVDGTNGKDGVNGNDGKDGVDGTNGKDGVNGNDGKDGVDGTNGKDGINGTDGKDGKDGVSPVLTAAQDTDGQFYWKVNGEWLKDGANKVPASRTPEITADTFDDGNKYWKIDGEWLKDEHGAMVRVTADATPVKFDAEVNEEAGTITFTFAGKNYTVNIAKSELEIVEGGTVAGFILKAKDNVYTVAIPAGWDVAKTTVRADIASNDKNQTAITRTGAFTTFTVKKENGNAIVTVTPDVNFANDALAELTITMTSADGEKLAGSIFVTMKAVEATQNFTGGTLAEALKSDATDPVFTDKIVVNAGAMTDNDWEAINNYPYATKLEISSTSVTAIPDNALKGNTRLAEFTGNGSMLTIGASAFEGCTALTTVNTVSNVEKLGMAAFKGCTTIATAPTFSNSLAEIPESAFEGCSKMTSAPIPSTNVLEIKARAFYGCAKLASLGTATGVATLGESAFEGCEELVDASGFSASSLQALPKNVFKGCKKLTTFQNSNVVSIDEGAFEGCTALATGTLTLGDLTTLEKYAFRGCKALTAIPDMATSLKTIQEEAFAGCGTLNNTTISNITTIEASAFKGCTFSGSSVAFPNVVTIKANAFENCTFSNATTFAATTIGTAAFKGVTFGNTIGFTLAETIGNNAFELCTFGGNVTFDAATSIGNKAFGGVDFGSNTLDFQAVITQLGTDAFTDATTGSATVKVLAGSAGDKYNKKWAGVTWGTVTEVPNP